MRLLLDTHLLLWAAYTPERLSPAARAMIEDLGNDLAFSPASVWEVVIKRALGRPDFRVDPRLLRRGLVENGYAELALTSDHALAVDLLPPLHNDRFDRMLLSLAAGGEERAEERSAVGLPDAADDLGAVEAAGLGEEAGAVVDAAAFGVVGAEDDASEAEMDGGGGAHWAGFEGHDQGAADQAGGAEHRRGVAHGEEFGVGGGVVVAFDAVAGLGQHGAVGGEHHGADRDLARRGGGAGLGQRGRHPCLPAIPRRVY